ncbi:MAG: sulfotransferase domain-containing protein [Proteobacteria bacterium]|nr:sulfotransferase domain-containing protein [Pseudomonadota bacterium]
MIIWLASYPRSGNTLTRNIFKKTMGFGTYSQHKMAAEVSVKGVDEYGILDYEGTWENFYKEAANSSELYLIKTHFLPTDNHPVIYVVRDGRLATESYLNQYQNRSQRWPGIDAFIPIYFDLLIGRDYYSDWSNHYNAWLRDDNVRRLELRYEDLVEPTQGLLESIADFVGYQGKIKSFVNERTKDNKEKPTSEHRGLGSWLRPEHRTEFEESIFLCLHGPLMQKLGYITKEEYDVAKEAIDAETQKLAVSAMQTARERYDYLKMSIEKEVVIQNLLKNQGRLTNGFMSKLKSWIS